MNLDETYDQHILTLLDHFLWNTIVHLDSQRQTVHNQILRHSLYILLPKAADYDRIPSTNKPTSILVQQKKVTRLRHSGADHQHD